MKTMKRIADALESIARDLHTLTTPTQQKNATADRVNVAPIQRSFRPNEWTEQEDRILADLYAKNMPLKNMVGYLPGRSMYAIQARASLIRCNHSNRK